MGLIESDQTERCVFENNICSVYLSWAKCLQKWSICGGSTYVVTCIWHCPIVWVVCVVFSCCPRITNFAWWLIRPIKICLPDSVQQDICIECSFTTSHTFVGSTWDLFIEYKRCNIPKHTYPCNKNRHISRFALYTYI